MTFFLPWSIEAKFFFIFGCLIALVVPIAGIIRIKNNWKMAKHTLLADEESNGREQVIQVADFEESTPFGIEAMEDDLEVDGIWNSKTSTPFHTPLPSPTTSSHDSNSIRNVLAKLSHSRRGSSISSVSRFELSETQAKQALSSGAVGQLDGEARNSASSAPGVARNIEQPAFVPLTGDSQLSSKDFKITMDQPKIKYKAHCTFEDTMQISEAATRFIPSNHTSNKSRKFVVPSRSTSNSSSHNVIETPSILRDLETLGHMEAHRKVQAAESGRLQPRNRDITQSSLSRIALQQGTLANDTTRKTLRSISWPMAGNETIVKMVVPQSKPQRRVSPPAVPLRAFVEVHPPPKVCPSAWTDKTQGLLEEKLGAAAKLTSFTITTAAHSRSSSFSSDSTASATLSMPHTMSIHDSSLRQPRDSFELLPPDHLEKPAPVKRPGRSFNLFPRYESGFHVATKPNRNDASRTWNETYSADGTVCHHESLHSPLGSTVC